MGDEVLEMVGLGIGIGALGIGTSIFMKSMQQLEETNKKKNKKRKSQFL